MASVVSFPPQRRRAERPTLVLAGLHQSRHAFVERELSGALRNCQMLLSAARSSRLSVAFVRCMPPPVSVSEPRAYPAWLRGFEPTRDDMIFDVTQPSCYSNNAFAQAMEDTAGNFAMAGLLGETTCLSTAVDAYHRRHRSTYLFDASISAGSGAIPKAVFHDSVSQIISLYGEIMESTEWCSSLTQNKKML